MPDSRTTRMENTSSQSVKSSESGTTQMLNWILRLIPAVIVGRAAWMKFDSHPDVSMMFDSLGMEPGGRFLIGVIEALCVVSLLSPRISAWGGLLCLGVMTGAIIAHTTVIGFDGTLAQLFAMALLSGGCSVAIIYRLRSQIPFIRDMFET
jgi:putative oxidoreductase